MNMDILSAIGNTPIVELKKLNPNPNVKVYCKLEGNNPGGSVKDRPASYMIKKAIESGELTKDKTIIEATSGNTGIGLSWIASVLGIHVDLCIPESASKERIQTLQALGAEVILTPAKEKADGAIRKAQELLSLYPDKYVLLNQFENPNNWLSHYETTGPEIWKQTEGQITHFVAGMGTSGTLMGNSRFFKEKNPNIQICGVEPYVGHTLQGLKNMEESIVPKIFERNRLDETIMVSDADGYEMARKLAKYEGIFCGMSSGASAFAACQLAQRIEKGVIVCITCDRGDRYLSTTLFKQPAKELK